MLAYKFRSAQNMQFVFDILLNNRLYCADWKYLNDPMEGLFRFRPGGRSKDDGFVQDIIDQKVRYKVCSLAAGWKSTLMWSHYASAYTGVAIECELPAPIHGPLIDHAFSREALVACVEYRDEAAFSRVDQRSDPAIAACNILLSKQIDWIYEEEIRILSHEPYYPIDVPRKVIAGHLMDPGLFDALKLICRQKGIQLQRLSVQGGRLSVEPVRRAIVEPGNAS